MLPMCRQECPIGQALTSGPAKTVCLALRTRRAASALAISLSRTASKARQLLIFGSGLQALWHAKLVASLSSELKEILVATRAISERSECVLGDLRKHFHGHNIQVRGISIDDAVAPQGPVERADIVCWSVKNICLMPRLWPCSIL